MNKTAIKNFAIWARNKLIADIQYRAGLMGITAEGIKNALPQSTPNMEFYDIGTAEPYSITGEAIRQRQKLVEILRQKEKDSDYSTAYKYILEEVAYTWFNRLIAIRFMEVNDYLPSHIRVLSSESGKVEPDLVTTPFDAELDFTPDEQETILRLKTDNALDELFRLLFIKQCNALNEILPALFEKTSDYTEVLLNISVVDQEGVVYHLIHDIDEDDFNIEKGGQVEIIGWLYQYYNTEPKDAAFALLKKNVKISKERIPAATQLFTPDWIVRYMVENSLGRLWVEGHPDCGLKENWKYYLEEAQQEPEVQAKLSEIRKEYAALNPEDIKLIDPCMGSGHILVYAFDVLMQIYESAGYSQRDAAKSILEHNIYGLDIDDRAYQLAYFAVMMKARQYNRRILNGENTCHVYAIQESNSINRAHLKFFGAGLSDLEKNTAKMQLEGLLDTLTDAKEYGSILNVESYNWDLLRRFVAAEDTAGQISMDSVGVEDTAEQLNRLIDIGETMARKYWVTCTNPPYAGISNLSAKVNNFVKKYYPDSKADLFAVFIEHCRTMTADNGYQAMITQHSWMFLSSFEKLREKMMLTETVNMAHLGARAFEEIGGEVVQTTAFVRCANHVDGYKGTYCRLIEPTSQQGKEDMFLAGENRFTAAQDNFSKIPGSPIAYWLSNSIFDLFALSTHNIREYSFGEGKNVTTNNAKYILFSWEVDVHKIGAFEYKWLPCAMGGEYRRWYGNIVNVIDWSENARQFYRSNPAGRIIREEFWRMPGVTWGKIGSGSPSFRILGKNQMYQETAILQNDESDSFFILAVLNSKVSTFFLNFLAPTMNFQLQDICAIPLPSEVFEHKSEIEKIAKDCTELSSTDWDSFEISRDFEKHPICKYRHSVSKLRIEPDWIHQSYYLKDAYQAWEYQCNLRFDKLREN